MKFEKFIQKFVKGVKYFSILCIGCGIALLIEYGIEFDFIAIIVLSSILLYGTSVKLKEDAKDAEI